MQPSSPFRWLKRAGDLFKVAIGVSFLAANCFPVSAQDAVRVTWNPNTEVDLAGYRVYSGTTSKGLSIAATVTGATSARLTGLAPGTKYYFAVQAFNSTGLASDLSPEVSFTTRVLMVPDLSVSTPDGVELSSGSAVFESPATSVGASSVPQRLIIANTGNADLTSLSFSLSGENPDDFEISTEGITLLNSGTSTGLMVSFIPREAGLRSADLTISSNDPDESSFVIRLKGTGEQAAGVLLPEISIQSPSGTGLSSGTSVPFGVVDLRNTSSPRSILIRNIGLSPLGNIAVSVEGAHRSDFVLTGAVPGQLGAGESAAIQVAFHPSAAGTRSAVLRIASDDADESLFQLALGGTGVAHPEITLVHSNGNDLTDGASTLSFGSLILGAAGTSQTVTLTNTGTGDLTGISAILEGAAPGDFLLSGQPPSLLAPGASSSLTITFLPTASGARSAFLRISNSDSDENPFDLQLAGTGVAVPEIGIEKPDGSPLTDGGASIGFGVVSLGTDTVSQSLTIRNSGTADLTGIAVTASGTNASDFTISGPQSVVVAPGGTTTFTVTFRPGAAGTRTASVQVTSNDADENPFDLSISGTGVANPEIALQNQDGTALVDGGAGITFGAVNLSSGAISQTLTIRNVGTASLTGISTSMDGSHASDFNIPTPPPTSLAPGASASFSVTFKPAGTGTRSAFFRIASNDTDESPFDIALAGVGFTEPEIAIEKADSSPVADGGSHLYPSLLLGTATSVQSFTIRNSGNAALTGLALLVAGNHPQDFTTSTLATNTLQPGASASFTITFKPSAGGARSAIIRVASNDADENPYDINVSGTGLTAPEIAVERSDATLLLDGASTLSMESVILGSATSTQTLTIRNSGSANLTGLAASMAGAHTSDFTHSAIASTTLAPGATTTLTLTFKPGASGTRTAILQIASNDADENPYDINLTGIGVVLPEIAIERSDASPLADGITALPFGTLNLSSSGATQNLTIRNTGSALLSGIAISIDGTHAGDFTVTAAPSTSLAPGASTVFSIRFRPLAIGARAAFARVASNDMDENPFDIPLSGTGFTEPEIALEKSGGSAVADGGSHAYPALILGPATSVQSFIVRNNGNSALTGLALSFAGSHPQDFSASTLSATSLAPGASLSFNVTFKPSGGGGRSAVLRLASNDADENPYDISLTGTGITVPEIGVETQEGSLIADGTGSIAFPPANLGSSAALRIIHVRNSGSGNLNVSSLSLDGLHAADFIIFPIAPITLAPGALAQFPISFRPSAAGNRSAWLRINNDDADESVYDILVSGTGVAVPEISIAPNGGSDLQSGAAGISFQNVELLSAGTSRTLVIRNDGMADLSGLRAWIDGAHAADFTISQPRQTTLAPGASASIDLSFIPSLAGPRTATLRIASNDADESEFSIALAGNGVALPQIEISLATAPPTAIPAAIPAAASAAQTAQAYSFGSFELRSASPEVTYIVRNRGSADLADLSLQLADGHLGDFTLRKFTITRLAPGLSSTFSVSFRPTMIGQRKAAIRISSNDPTNRIIDIPLTGTGFAKPEIGVLAENVPVAAGVGVLDFGKLDVGAPVPSKSVTIINTGTAPLERLGLSILGSAAGFLTEPLPKISLAPGERMTFAVMFRPTAAGFSTGELRITSNDADESAFTLKLAGTGVTKPILTISRPPGPDWGPEGGSLALGAVLPGSKPRSQTILLRNSGTASLNITAIRTSGPNSGDFTPIGLRTFVLAPGTSQNLTIQFSPKAAGARNALLEIQSNDPNRPKYDIPLSGTGIATPKMEIAIGSQKIADSEFIGIAPSSSRLITIRNRGTAPLTKLTAKITEGTDSGFSIVPLKNKSILPGKSATLKVTLKRTANSTAFAYLRITSNDPLNGEFDVVLTAASGSAKRKKAVKADSRSAAPLPFPMAEPKVSTIVVNGLRYRCITIRHAADAGILANSVEVSPDLLKWFSGKAHTTVMVDRPGLLRIRDNVPVTATGKRFIRLRKP